MSPHVRSVPPPPHGPFGVHGHRRMRAPHAAPHVFACLLLSSGQNAHCHGNLPVSEMMGASPTSHRVLAVQLPRPSVAKAASMASASRGKFPASQISSREAHVALQLPPASLGTYVMVFVKDAVPGRKSSRRATTAPSMMIIVGSSASSGARKRAKSLLEESFRSNHGAGPWYGIKLPQLVQVP